MAGIKHKKKIPTLVLADTLVVMMPGRSLMVLVAIREGRRMTPEEVPGTIW